MVRSALRDVGRRGGVEVVLVPLLRQVDHDRLVFGKVVVGLVIEYGSGRLLLDEQRGRRSRNRARGLASPTAVFAHRLVVLLLLLLKPSGRRRRIDSQDRGQR